MEPQDDPSLPSELREIIAKIKLKREYADHVDQKLDPQSEKIEREVLMTLWSDLGNQFEYYQCLHAASQFIKALKGMRKVSKMPLEVSIVLQRALVECAKGDLDALIMIKEAREKYGLES